MRMFLKKIAAYVNARFLSKYIDNEYWQLADQSTSKKVSVVENTVFFDRLLKNDPGFDTDDIKKNNPAVYNYATQIFSRYLYKITDCIIDPTFNWVILDNKNVFRYSWPLIEDPWDAVKTRPSLAGFLLKGQPREIEKGILVKFSWNNYYHFFFDTLPQIYLCDTLGIPQDVPLIVPHNYNNMQFIRDYFARVPLKRNVIVQEEGVYLKVRELFIAKDAAMSDSIKHIVSDLRVAYNDFNDRKYRAPEYLFISRNKKYKRTLRNIDEITQIAKEKGFDIIEPANYTSEEQLYLFSNAKYVVGIHGAGLTSVIFSKNPALRILEILPGKELTPGHYKSIATYFNYDYRSIEGDGLDIDGNFSISKEAFAGSLNNMLEK